MMKILWCVDDTADHIDNKKVSSYAYKGYGGYDMVNTCIYGRYHGANDVEYIKNK